MSKFLLAIAVAVATFALAPARAATTITLATFPDLDRAARAALPR